VIKNNNSCDASFTATLDSNNRVKVVAKNKNYTSYYWNFGDGTSSTNQSDTHSYRSAGYKTICLGVYDSTKNCQDSVCKTILINGNNNRKCKAEFRYSASKNTVSFTNASTNTQGSKSGMAYSWSFGDGKSSNTKSPSHTYSKDGIYNVCLSLYDSAGRCQSSYCDSVEIKGSCYSYFEVVLDSSTKYRLKLINKASKKSTHFYRWTFGDGNTSTSRNPSHTYQSFGWYEVCLKVMDTSLKCITTYCDSIGMDSTGKMLKNGAFEIVISDDGKLNVSDNEKLDFSIYPNPVRDVLTLNLAYTKPGHSHYQMIDLLGRVVAESEIISLKSEISVRDLTPGIYWVRVIQGQTVSVKKIIVNR
jgi:PKD repeat protein